MKHDAFPELVLGSAMWGWTVGRNTAFQLLDYFYESGFRSVDGATNYPIDKNPGHFRLSEQILAEWTRVNQVNDLRVIMKVGSLDNMRSPDHNLTKSFLLLAMDHYGALFGGNLDTLMIHWDNRDDEAAIRESYEALAIAQEKGIAAGLSGIRRPEIHALVNQAFGLDLLIQIKHNLLYSDYERYAPFHGKRRFIAYGINAGGIKLEKENYTGKSSLIVRGGKPDEEFANKVRSFLNALDQRSFPAPLTSFNQLAMIHAFYSPGLAGILAGPSGIAQLADTIQFYSLLKEGAYASVYGVLTAGNQG